MKLIITLMLIMSCSSHSLDSYKNEGPTLNLETFFNGRIKALGIVQNRAGEVVKRFTVKINARWNGDVAILDEDFVYSDGTTSKRIWTLSKNGNKEYLGTAADVVGNAEGRVSGNAFYFEYVLNVPVDEQTYEVRFSDWMYLLDKKTLLARTYMTKFGIDLGEVTIVMINEDM